MVLQKINVMKNNKIVIKITQRIVKMKHNKINKI